MSFDQFRVSLVKSSDLWMPSWQVRIRLTRLRCLTCCIYSSHRTHQQIYMQNLWCCLHDVWTLPLTIMCSISLCMPVARCSVSCVNWALLRKTQKLSQQLHRPLQKLLWVLASLFKIASTWLPVPFRTRLNNRNFPRVSVRELNQWRLFINCPTLKYQEGSNAQREKVYLL